MHQVTGDASDKEVSPVLRLAPGALNFYAPIVKNSEDYDFPESISFPESELALTTRVGRPSSPARLAPIKSRSGATSYRVTATIRGQQRKLVTRDLAVAKETLESWELERVTNQAIVRNKLTFLTNAKLREAEAAVAILGDRNITLRELAIKELKNAAPETQAPEELSLERGLQQFLEARQKHVSVAQYDNLRRRNGNFAEHFGLTRGVHEITTEAIESFFTSHEWSRKTWNNYRGDVDAFINWLVKKKHLPESPMKGVAKYSKRMLPKNPPKRMSAATAQELMRFVEVNYPEWCTYFTICLFLGVRPSVREGEAFKLANAAKKDGVGQFFHEDRLFISGPVAKDRRPRTTTIPQNAKAWLAAYPPTPTSICPGDYELMKPIRDKFALDADIMRHTAISAYLAIDGNMANASAQFGNSAGVILDHYFCRMERDEAERFYSIVPK